jgi:hypothetical protein
VIKASKPSLMNINLVYAKTHQAAEILHIFENKTAPLDIKGV